VEVEGDWGTGGNRKGARGCGGRGRWPRWDGGRDMSDSVSSGTASSIRTAFQIDSLDSNEIP